MKEFLQAVAVGAWKGAVVVAVLFGAGYLIAAGAALAVDDSVVFYADKEECKQYLVAPFTGISVIEVECE